MTDRRGHLSTRKTNMRHLLLLARGPLKHRSLRASGWRLAVVALLAAGAPQVWGWVGNWYESAWLPTAPLTFVEGLE